MSSYTFPYRPQLPHGKAWSQGYTAGQCSGMVASLGDKATGPHDGICLKLINIPWHGRDPLYLRFWAARGGTEKWKDFQEAYEERGPMGKEPSLNYPNGGMVKVSKKGEAKFRLHLPRGYMADGGFIPPHFHYCLCYQRKRSPVHTVYLEQSRTHGTLRNSLLVYQNPRHIESEQRGLFERHYNLERPQRTAGDLHHHHHHHHHQKEENHNKPTPIKKPTYALKTCSTFLDTNCLPYKILPQPVSGTITTTSSPYQAIKMRKNKNERAERS